jgi:hypothetical protein
MGDRTGIACWYCYTTLFPTATDKMWNIRLMIKRLATADFPTKFRGNFAYVRNGFFLGGQ